MVSTDVLEGIAQYSKSEIYFKCKVCFEGFSDEHILELHISSCHPFEDSSTESDPKIEVQDASTTESTPKNEIGFNSFEDSSTESPSKIANENGPKSASHVGKDISSTLKPMWKRNLDGSFSCIYEGNYHRWLNFKCYYIPSNLYYNYIDVVVLL